MNRRKIVALEDTVYSNPFYDKLLVVGADEIEGGIEVYEKEENDSKKTTIDFIRDCGI